MLLVWFNPGNNLIKIKKLCDREWGVRFSCEVGAKSGDFAEQGEIIFCREVKVQKTPLEGYPTPQKSSPSENLL